MKKIYIVGGTMGVGKSTVCRILKEKLDNSAFLDGDWCWDSHPFQVTDETKRMVMQNICFLLNQFIRCTAYENVIFCWVMHEQSIIDEILRGIDGSNCRINVISLVCREEELRERLLEDVEAEKREIDVVERSLLRIPYYEKLDTIKIDTNGKEPDEIADEIMSI